MEVRSAIRDEALDGWTTAECTPFTGDELDAAVHWGNKGLCDLRGKVVRLRFQMKDAALFAFDFKNN